MFDVRTSIERRTTIYYSSTALEVAVAPPARPCIIAQHSCAEPKEWVRSTEFGITFPPPTGPGLVNATRHAHGTHDDAMMDG